MSTPTCHHVLAGGALCQASPLRNRDYCRFHLQQVGRRMKAARMRARHQAIVLKLPLLEDLHSVQIALMQLADAIAYREIEPQYARLLTTVLRLAMQNLKSRPAWQFSGEQPDEVTEWNSFEQEHDLPAGLDLSLDPEVAFPPHQDDSGIPSVPGVGRYGNDDPLRAQVRQALADAEASPPPVTADQVELMEIYHSQGDKAATKFADKMVRNDRRRERYMQRARYEELARQHSIKRAAARLVEDQRQAEAASARAQAAAAPPISPDDSQTLAQSDPDTRKPPQSQVATSHTETARDEA